MVPYQVVHTDYPFTAANEPAIRVLATQAMDFPFLGAYVLNLRSSEMDDIGFSYVESIALYVRSRGRRFRVYFKPEHPRATDLQQLNADAIPGTVAPGIGLTS